MMDNLASLPGAVAGQLKLLADAPLALATIPTLSPTLLRQRIATLWANYKEVGRPHLTFGAALARVKTERLFQEWGWPSLFRYCRHELGLVPSGAESFLICAYHRLVALDCTVAEMEQWERRYYLRALVTASRYCKTKESLVEVLDGDPLTFHLRLKAVKHRTPALVLAPVREMKPGDVEIVEAVLGHLTKYYNLRREKGMVTMALVVKAHVEAKSGHRQGRFRRWCKWYGLPESLAEHFFAGEVQR